MKVSDIMSSNVVTVKKETSILDVMRLMRDKNIGFIVVSEDEKAIGVITDRDIIIQLSKEISNSTQILKIMKKYVITIDKNTDVKEASDLMGYMQVRRLVVIDDNNKIKGVLSVSDLLRYPLSEDLALETLIEISYNYPTQSDFVNSTFQTSAFIF